MNTRPSGWLILLKARVADVICHPIIGRMLERLFGGRIPCRGVRFSVSDSVDHTTKARMFWGLYERAESEFVRQYLRSDLDVVELGSGIGVISVQIARSRSPGTRVVCVEANSQLMSLLKYNVASHAPACAAEFVNRAVCEVGLPTVTFVPGLTHVTSRVALEEHSSAEAHHVPATSFGALLEKHGISRFALVCDIEGAEVCIILSEDLRSRCRQMIIELHETIYRGELWTVDGLIHEIEARHGLILRARHGTVCLFEPGGAA